MSTDPSALISIPILHSGDLYYFWIDPVTHWCHTVELHPGRLCGRPHIEEFETLDPVVVEKFDAAVRKLKPLPSNVP